MRGCVVVLHWILRITEPVLVKMSMLQRACLSMLRHSVCREALRPTFPGHKRHFSSLFMSRVGQLRPERQSHLCKLVPIKPTITLTPPCCLWMEAKKATHHPFAPSPSLSYLLANKLPSLVSVLYIHILDNYFKKLKGMGLSVG